MKKSLLFILLLMLSGVPALAQTQPLIAQIAESHIEGNVPNSEDFDSYMKRDLDAYFQSVTGKAVEIKFELLREGPTQTGIAYPKFYLWVKLFEKDALINEGAVRVAAIEKKGFDVTNLLGRKEIEQNPEAIYSVFPRQVGDRIKNKIRQ